MREHALSRLLQRRRPRTSLSSVHLPNGIIGAILAVFSTVLSVAVRAELVAVREELPTEVRTAAQATLGDLVAHFSSTPATGERGRIVILPLDPDGRNAQLDHDLSVLIATELRAAGWTKLESADELSTELQKVFMDLQDMRDKAKRVAFYSTAPAAGIDWFLLFRHDRFSDPIQLQMTLEDVRRKGTGIESSRDIPRSDAVLMYLGEPLPKTLFVSAPSGAVIRVEGKVQGVARGEPTAVRLLGGSHDVKIQLDGYAEYSAPVVMPGDQNMRMVVERRSNAGAPLASLLCGAVLPGWAISKYGEPVSADGSSKSRSSAVAGMGAIVFYAGIGAWAVDRVLGKEGLTKETIDRREKIENAELAIGLGGYALNLIGSFAIGHSFAKKNRTLILEQFSGAPNIAEAGLFNGKVGLAMVARPDGTAAVLSYSGHF